MADALVKGLHADPFDLAAMKIRDQKRGESPACVDYMFLAALSARASLWARGAAAARDGGGAGMSRRHPVLSRSYAVLILKGRKSLFPGTPCAPAVHHMLVHRGSKKSLKNCVSNRLNGDFVTNCNYV
jgi:hypothetical protein